MSDVIERIKEQVKRRSKKMFVEKLGNKNYVYLRAIGTKELYSILDEESAKEPQECKWTKGINSVETCWGDIDIKIFNQFKRQGAKFCPYCGRKIKVIEDD